jgi:uncharacterized membrane protein AbrB (regulator of aidB expression)
MINTINKNTGLGYDLAGFGIDTVFVLFFLSLEYGRAVQLFSIDAALMLTTIAMLLILPYFLPSKSARPTLSGWLKLRGLVAIAGLTVGVLYSRSIGLVLPESFKFVPMTLLILTAMISCYIQFYALMRLRLAK